MCALHSALGSNLEVVWKLCPAGVSWVHRHHYMMVLEREFASLEHDLCRPRQAGVPQHHQLFSKRRGEVIQYHSAGVCLDPKQGKCVWLPPNVSQEKEKQAVDPTMKEMCEVFTTYQRARVPPAPQ